MDNLENLIEPELKEIIQEVINQLRIDENEELTSFTQIDKQRAIDLLRKEDCIVYSAFKDQLLTPYAIAKYLMLLKEESHLIELVEDDIKTLNLSDDIQWTVAKGFVNEVSFIKLKEYEKSQGMVVKYRLDTETNKIYYTISTGSWGWDVTKQQLSALLNEKEMPTVNDRPISKADLSFTFNGMQIEVKKI